MSNKGITDVIETVVVALSTFFDWLWPEDDNNK